jgi:carboxyl-terminal processing protease
MNHLAKKIAFSLSLLIFGYISVGYLLGKAGDDKPYHSLTVFSEVLERIQQDYVDEPNMHLVTVGALRGLLESLDPESAYLSPREYADFKVKSEKAARGDVGLALSKRFGYTAIVSVLPDSPAQMANLHDGDLLEAVAGFTTREMSLGQAQLLLQGEPGTAVKLSVVRRGTPQPQEVDLTRAPLAPPHILTERYEGDIAYLRVPEFNPGRAREIRDKLVQLDHQGAHKLILDLRECAEGDISEAIATAQLFLSSGTIATLKGQTITTRTFSADPSKVAWKQPMTVLISAGTAGPAEVLAAAIADNQRGDTVGQTTFGTASEQKLIPLQDGAALILTVADYYTPASKLILSEGVTPKVEVRGDELASAEKEEAPAGQLPSANDQTFKRALEILKGAAPAKRAA